MTEVSFHFNVQDKVPYLCRLLRKVNAAGKQALVLLPEAELRALDVALWTFSQADFIPHAVAGDPPQVLSRSPVVLSAVPVDVAHPGFVVNALPGVPQGFERFEKVIEVVGFEAEDRQQARARWKHYSQAGYAVQQHDVAHVQKAAS